MKKSKLISVVILMSFELIILAQTSDQLIRLHNISSESNFPSQPFEGSLVYVTQEKKIYKFNSNQWRSTWTNLGNSNIDLTNGFLGTNDNTDLRFRTNNVQRMVVKNDGKVGINLNNPAGRFQVNTASSNAYIEIASHGVASCNNGHDPELAIDNDPTGSAWNNGWNSQFWSFDWLMIDLTSMNLELPVVRYTLRSPFVWGEPFHSNITIWELEGSLDGINWTNLHARNSFASTNSFSWDWGQVSYNINNDIVYNRYRIMVHAGSTGIAGTLPYFSISDFELFVRDTVDFTDDFIVDTDGEVGVGIVPTEALHVNGNILASGTITPDYVFESYYDNTSTSNPNYKFQSLNDVKMFVANNKHLPNVPSSKDIEQQGGIIVNESTEINLEKIEELYLYMFQQKARNNFLKKRLNYLKKCLENLLN